MGLRSIAIHLQHAARSNFRFHLRVRKSQDQLRGFLEKCFFRIIEVRHVTFGKPESENRPRLRPEEENQRSEPARLSSAGPRNALA